MIQTIRIVPDLVLRQKSQSVKKVDKKIVQFIKDLEETLIKSEDPPGVGISAPQIGKSLRIFSTYLPKGNIKDRPDLKNKTPVIITYVNPEIIQKSKKLTLGPNPKKPILEGCLSIPRLYGPVMRHQWIKLKYYELSVTGYELHEKTKKFSFFPARVIQHEIDHLDGTLFTGRSIKQQQPLYEESNGKLNRIDYSPQLKSALPSGQNVRPYNLIKCSMQSKI